MEEKYSKTFTSFSGADAIVSFDGKVIGELQEVKWNKKIGDYLRSNIEGTMKAIVFDRDPLKEYEGKNFDVLTQYMNEYGQRRLEFIWQARLETKAGGVSIDQIVQEVEYTFKADDVTDVPWLDTHEEMMEYMLENMDSYETNKKMHAKAYAHLLKFGMSIGRFKVIENGDYISLLNAKKEAEPVRFDAANFAQEIIKHVRKEQLVYK